MQEQANDEYVYLAGERFLLSDAIAALGELIDETDNAILLHGNRSIPDWAILEPRG